MRRTRMRTTQLEQDTPANGSDKLTLYVFAIAIAAALIYLALPSSVTELM